MLSELHQLALYSLRHYLQTRHRWVTGSLGRAVVHHAAREAVRQLRAQRAMGVTHAA